MKTITHYYCRKSYSTQTTNKLQEAVLEYFNELHGTLICVENLDELKSDILAVISSFNAEYKRCTPYNVSFREEENQIYINGIYPIRFSLENARLTVL